MAIVPGRNIKIQITIMENVLISLSESEVKYLIKSLVEENAKLRNERDHYREMYYKACDDLAYVQGQESNKDEN